MLSAIKSFFFGQQTPEQEQPHPDLITGGTTVIRKQEVMFTFPSTAEDSGLIPNRSVISTREFSALRQSHLQEYAFAALETRETKQPIIYVAQNGVLFTPTIPGKVTVMTFEDYTNFATKEDCPPHYVAFELFEAPLQILGDVITAIGKAGNADKLNVLFYTRIVK